MLTLLKRAFRDFNDDECMVRAAALAYYTVFALPPMLVLLLMLGGAVWDPSDVQRAMQGQFASLLGSDGASAIQRMIESADRPGRGGIVATILGTAALLFGATGAFLQLQSALNRAWEVRPDPEQGGIMQFVRKRLLSLGMILGVAFLLVVSLALSALLTAVGERLNVVTAPVLQVLNVVVSFAVLTVVFAAMFKVLPDAVIEWRDVWAGAAATSLLFVAGKFVIGLYLGRSAPGDAFGAASALAVILVWIYYAGIIVLFGAELTQAWADRRGAAIRPEKGAIRVDRQRQEDRAAVTQARDAAPASHFTSRRTGTMEHRDTRDPGRMRLADSGNGRGTMTPAHEPSLGELFRRLSSDSSHLIRQEITLARAELAETGSRLGSAATKFGVALAVALPGVLALTAFLVIGLGDLMDNYWASALLVAIALLGTAAVLAKRAQATLKEGVGMPDTIESLRDDAEWARDEVKEFKRELTA